MKKRRVIFFAAVPVIIAIVIMLTMAQLLSSMVLQTWLKTRIQSQVATLLNGELDYRQIQVKLLPKPGVSLVQGSLLLPEKLKAHFDNLNLELAIAPMFKGRVKISSIRIANPRIQLPHRFFYAKSAPRSIPFSLYNAPENIEHALTFLVQTFPDYRLEIKNGTLILEGASDPAFMLDHITAELRIAGDKIVATGHARSKMLEDLHVDLSFLSESLTGSGSISFSGLDIGQLLKKIDLPSIPISISAAMDGRIEFKTDRFSDFSAKLDSHASNVNLKRNESRCDVTDLNLSAGLKFNSGLMQVRLNHLTFDEPNFQLEGSLRMKGSGVQALPTMELELASKNVDLMGLRTVLEVAAGDTVWVRKLLPIVKGGRIPQLNLHSIGSSFKELICSDQFQLTSEIGSLRLQLPWLSKELELTGGKVGIREKKLKADQMTAVLGKSNMQQGRFQLDLADALKPFELRMNMTADMEDVHSILLPLLKKTKLANIVSDITRIKGEARGQLNLNNHKDALAIRADLDRFDVTAAHKRLPGQLTLAAETLHYSNTRIEVSNLTGKLLKSQIRGLTGSFDWDGEPKFDLNLKSGGVEFCLAEIFNWAANYASLRNILLPIKSISGTLRLTDGSLNGPLIDLEQWVYFGRGAVKDLYLESDSLPTPLAVETGDVTFVPGAFSGRWHVGTLLDTTTSGTYLVRTSRRKITQIEIVTSGKVGTQLLTFLEQYQNLPRWSFLKGGGYLNLAEVNWYPNGELKFAVDMTLEDKIHFRTTGSYRDATLMVEKFFWQDPYSRFNSSVYYSKPNLKFSFKGNLSSKSIAELLAPSPFFFREVRGNFNGSLDLNALNDLHLNGTAALQDFSYRIKNKSPIIIQDLILEAVSDQVKIESTQVQWEKNIFAVHGQIDLGDKSTLLDLNLSSAVIDLDRIVELIDTSKPVSTKDRSNGKKKEFWEKYPLQGIVRLRINTIRWNAWEWSDLKANIALNQNRADLHLMNIELCGLTFSGRAEVSPDEYFITIHPAARNLPIQPANNCLRSTPLKLDGSFDLEGDITGRGKGEAFLRSLDGELTLSARNGRIYENDILTGILAFINITEIFAGKASDLGQDGLGYDSILLSFDIDAGRLNLVEGLLNAHSLTLSAEGVIDPNTRSINLKILAAPFKTIDRIVQNIPIINYILHGTLISIPMQIKGDLSSPRVIPLPPAAVGEGLIGIMKRTLQVPFQILPFASSSQSEDQSK